MLRISFAVCLLSVLNARSCISEDRALVLCIDESYQCSVLATSAAGFAAPDEAVWHDDRAYLADEAGNSVVSWSPTEGLHRLASRRNGLKSPEDLVIADDGTVFFTDDDAGGLWQVSPAGDVSQLAGKSQGLVSTEGLALAPDGSLLVGDGTAHKVFRVTRSGDVSVFLDDTAGITKPESLVYDPEGNLYIADNEQNIVYRVDGELHVRKLIDEADGIHPESICYHQGALFITDDEAGKLYSFVPGERPRAVLLFAGSLKNLQGVAEGPDGSLLVTVQDLELKTGYLLQVTQLRPK